ncbi:MAG: M23 family metallopeptidase [Bacteroidetes bacterium]|nr:MAG: M23 family metallopeptidase [Bacteroidota bacterium]
MKYLIYTVLLCIVGLCFVGAVASTQAFRRSALWSNIALSRHNELGAVHVRERLARTPNGPPVWQYATLGSRYGMRRHPILRRWQMHWGVDFPVRTGTPVLAVAKGRVRRVVSRYRRKGYGKYILLEHDHAYSSLYAHLSQVFVRKGQLVHKGDTIGLSGNTGLSTNPHLHFELRRNGHPIDPLKYWDTCGVDLSGRPGLKEP